MPCGITCGPPSTITKGVFEDSTFWNNTLGIDVSYAANTIFRNLKVVHALGPWPHTAIGSNEIAHDITYDNLTVVGYNRGLVVAKAGYSIVNGGYFNNQFNIVVETPSRQDRTVLIQGNITFGQLPASRLMGPHYNIAMRSDFEPDRYGYIDHYFYNNTVTLNFGSVRQSTFVLSALRPLMRCRLRRLARAYRWSTSD